MSAVGYALEKQRLLLAAAEQRKRLARHARELIPLCEAADRVRDGARWAQRHPEVVVGGVALVIAARPRVRQFLWRWSRRGFIAWKLWRSSLRWLEQSPDLSRTA